MAESGFHRNLKNEGSIYDFYLLDEAEVLGEGASSIVKKGVNIETGVTYAVKIIDKESLEENEKNALYNELKIMGIVDHPNIVRVQEYFEDKEIVFIVMELMQGGELFDRIVQTDHYTEKQAADAFRQIVDAVRYCHSIGIVHRDLKPENLLYTTREEDAVLKVSDFGFAKFLIPKSQQKLFTACGTPSYVAPEIINKEGHDSKADCWSLGVILYVMLCGFPPFYSEDNNELFQLIKEAKFEFHSPYWDKISEGAKDLIKKLLVLDPKKRLSAEEILNHPWITEMNHSGEKLPFQEDYKDYRKKNVIKNAVTAKLIIDLWQKITFKKK